MPAAASTGCYTAWSAAPGLALPATWGTRSLVMYGECASGMGTLAGLLGPAAVAERLGAGCDVAVSCPGIVVHVDGTATGAEAGPGDGRPAPQPRSGYEPVWWALAFAVVTTAGLGLLAWGLLIMHALIYGAGAVVGPETIAAPDGARYRLGLTVAVVVNLATAAGLTRIAAHTPGRTWSPALQGLAAALLAAVAAGCALLVTVGINPVDFAVAG